MLRPAAPPEAQGHSPECFAPTARDKRAARKSCYPRPNRFIVSVMRELGAGIVVIGNEILSGKTVDSNSSFLARELRQLGVTLKRITVIPDEVEVIAETVRDF